MNPVCTLRKAPELEPPPGIGPTVPWTQKGESALTQTGDLESLDLDAVASGRHPVGGEYLEVETSRRFRIGTQGKRTLSLGGREIGDPPSAVLEDQNNGASLGDPNDAEVSFPGRGDLSSDTAPTVPPEDVHLARDPCARAGWGKLDRETSFASGRKLQVFSFSRLKRSQVDCSEEPFSGLYP